MSEVNVSLSASVLSCLLSVDLCDLPWLQQTPFLFLDDEYKADGITCHMASYISKSSRILVAMPVPSVQASLVEDLNKVMGKFRLKTDTGKRDAIIKFMEEVGESLKKVTAGLSEQHLTCSTFKLAPNALYPQASESETKSRSVSGPSDQSGAEDEVEDLTTEAQTQKQVCTGTLC